MGAFRQVEIRDVSDTGDGRGSSFPIDIPTATGQFTVGQIHATTLRPGKVRGNHFHVARDELLLVTYSDDWSFHWDSGDRTPVDRRSFSETGCVLIIVPPYASHAIRNDGQAELQITALSSLPFDPDDPDTFPRVLTND